MHFEFLRNGAQRREKRLKRNEIAKITISDFKASCERCKSTRKVAAMETTKIKFRNYKAE